MAGFRFNTNGNLAPVPGSPFKTSHSPSVVKGDPQGRFVFVGEDNTVPGTRGSSCANEPSILLVERVDAASGALTQVNNVTLRGSCVRDIAVDPSGRHLYVGIKNIATSGGSIQEFSIGATGTLTELAGSPVMVEELPVSFAMHPSGRLLFAATPNLTVLEVNPGTGALMVRGVFSTPKSQLALNSPGTFLIASERNTNAISEFQLDAGGNIIVETRQPAIQRFALAADPLMTVVRLH